MERRSLTLVEAQPRAVLDQSNRPVTRAELATLERALDALFAKSKIDIEFTRHFFDRVNDPRNKKQITSREISNIFKEVAGRRKVVNRIKGGGHNWEALLKDITTNINMPFVVNYDRSRQMIELVLKTVMRKKGFKTPDKTLVVQTKESEMLERRPLALAESALGKAVFTHLARNAAKSGGKSDGKSGGGSGGSNRARDSARARDREREAEKKWRKGDGGKLTTARNEAKRTIAQMTGELRNNEASVEKHSKAPQMSWAKADHPANVWLRMTHDEGGQDFIGAVKKFERMDDESEAEADKALAKIKKGAKAQVDAWDGLTHKQAKELRKAAHDTQFYAEKAEAARLRVKDAEDVIKRAEATVSKIDGYEKHGKGWLGGSSLARGKKKAEKAEKKERTKSDCTLRGGKMVFGFCRGAKDEKKQQESLTRRDLGLLR